jgi:hypothetical protein
MDMTRHIVYFITMEKRNRCGIPGPVVSLALGLGVCIGSVTSRLGGDLAAYSIWRKEYEKR